MTTEGSVVYLAAKDNLNGWKVFAMRRICLDPLFVSALVVSFFVSATAAAQDTISVDADATMHVCGDKNPASAGPCATAPRALSKASPAFPEKARRARHQGVVLLGVTIGKDGGVHDLRVIDSVDDAIDEAAMKAVSQWKFEPGTYHGNPVA